MTSVEKAKLFLAKSGKTLALRVAPLAVLAVSVAQAATFTGGGECLSNAEAFSISGTATLTNPFPAVNGITGFKGTGTCSTSYSGATFISTVFSLGSSITDGPLPPSVVLPVHWDFTPSLKGAIADGPEVDLTYVITFTIGGTEVFSLIDSVVAGQQVTGDTTITTPEGATDWSFVIEAGQEFSSLNTATGTLTLDVPNNSVDVGAATADVPEPSSLLLLSSGAALLVLRRRFRR